MAFSRLPLDGLNTSWTFDSYDPATKLQAEAKDKLTTMADRIRQMALDATSPRPKHPIAVNLYGPTGVGKSHLLHAFVQRILSGEPSLTNLPATQSVSEEREFIFCDGSDEQRKRDGFRILVLNNPLAIIDLDMAEDAKPDLVVIDHLFTNSARLSNIDDVDIRGWARFLIDVYDQRPVIVTASTFSQADLNRTIARRIDLNPSQRSRITDMPLACMRLDGQNKRGLSGMAIIGMDEGKEQPKRLGFLDKARRLLGGGSK